jgi:hypothetical protein
MAVWMPATLVPGLGADFDHNKERLMSVGRANSP